METLNAMLEEELTQAVEVKDAKSLRRYVRLMTGSFAEKREHEDIHRGFDEKFDRMIAEMASMRRDFQMGMADLRHESDKNFAVMNARFEAVDKRFEDANRRFGAVQWMLGIGLTVVLAVVSALVTLYQFT